jgi:hypothetical protein
VSIWCGEERVRLLQCRGRRDVRGPSARVLRPREKEANMGEGEGYVTIVEVPMRAIYEFGLTSTHICVVELHFAVLKQVVKHLE